ncbi:MAG: hypothetical protein ABI239_11185 [Aquihabitans sp.]
MTDKKFEAEQSKLTKVDDVEGVDPKLRTQVSNSTADVESASSALRRVIGDLHETQGAAWKRYAADLEQATNRLDAQLAMASARLRAEQAKSKPEIKDALTQLADVWRTRADEIRVHAHLGEMDARDVGMRGLEELDNATHRVTELATGVLDDLGESLTSLRDRVTGILDDIGQWGRASSD